MKLDDTIKLQFAADDPNEIIEWITVKGQHIPIKQGQDKAQVIKEHFDKLKALKPKPIPGAYLAKVKEKEIAKLAKYQANPLASKKIMGLWAYDSNIGKLYKAIMAGDWHSLSQLQQEHITGKLTVKEYLKSIENTGKRTGLWTVDKNKATGQVRLVMKDFGNAAKGQVEITDQQQHAALTAVSKLMSNTGLDTSFSKNVMDQFMKDAGLSTLADASSMIKDWTGSATTTGGTWLRKIASDYYGRPWSSEYSGKQSAYGLDKTVADKPVDPKIQAQVLALKALGTAYAQADGTQYVYRGTGVSKDIMNAIVEAKAKGSEFVYIPVNSLASYSTTLNKADDFGSGIVMRREVNPDDVWFCNKAMAHLFSSHQHENEWIMGSKDTAITVKTSDVWIKGKESEPPWKNPDAVYKEAPPVKLTGIDPKTGVDYLQTKVGSQQGSNQGGTYKGSDGVERYVKFYNNPGQGQGESLANSIYKDLNIGAPNSTVFNAGGKDAYASEIIQGGKTLQQTGTSSDDAKQVLKGFAADVLTANWDAVGKGLDNIMMKDGQAYRIDNGAAFLYRAQMGLKPEGVLNQITEWDKFFDPKVNKDYANLAAKAGVTKAEDVPGVKDQIKAIVQLQAKYGGWDNYVDAKMPNIKAMDGNKIVAMLNARTNLLLEKAKSMSASIDAGGPGSGRKPIYVKGLNEWKSEKKERELALKDPKQRKLPLKANEDNPESELGPISRKLGTKITKEGTQFCVYSDKEPLGCYPDMKQAKVVSKGGSFISPAINETLKAGKYEDQSKYGKHADVTHHAYKTVKWTVADDKTIIAPDEMEEQDYYRNKYKDKVKSANIIGGVVRAMAGVKTFHFKKPPKVGVPSTPNKHIATHKMPKGVGHKMTSPSMHKGIGVGHRFPNPSFMAADYGEPMAGNMSQGALDTRLWFTPPSLANRGKGNHVPVDDPMEKNDKFLDVTKRNSKDTKKQRMKLLKRGVPGGLPAQLPAHTSLTDPTMPTYLPGMFGKAISTRPARDIRDKRTFRAYGAAQI